ncbi:MAG: pyruvate, water dikinase regulatory protein [Alphaproteobacteria bacterium]
MDCPQAGKNIVKNSENFFHLHLISDSTGETLQTVSNAATSQYTDTRAITHSHAMVQTASQIDRVVKLLEEEPGLVLYTLVDHGLGQRLEAACRNLGIPCASVLEPILQLMQSYLGAPGARRAGAQHVLDADYFKRIDALTYTMMHDDGQLTGPVDEADIVLVGISRTSKTPTCIYLANRGLKAANIPLVPDMPLPPGLESATRPLIVGLIASPERIMQLRENRILTLNASEPGLVYVDRRAIAQEIAATKRLCAGHQWPVIDVTQRSIEETATAIMQLYAEMCARRDARP